jgi:hypothetical protein
LNLNRLKIWTIFKIWIIFWIKFFLTQRVKIPRRFLLKKPPQVYNSKKRKKENSSNLKDSPPGRTSYSRNQVQQPAMPPKGKDH